MLFQASPSIKAEERSGIHSMPVTSHRWRELPRHVRQTKRLGQPDWRLSSFAFPERIARLRAELSLSWRTNCSHANFPSIRPTSFAFWFSESSVAPSFARAPFLPTRICQFSYFSILGYVIARQLAVLARSNSQSLALLAHTHTQMTMAY